MRVNQSIYTVYELTEMLDRNDLVINRDYQRQPGIWPDYAQSYFIDTLLEGYAVPKLYFYQNFERSHRRPIKEVIDGQQRLTALDKFVKNKLKLTSASKNFSGMYFEDLDEEQQEQFISSSIQADVILGANRAEILEMFRRMNSYTAPLNAAELRHSEYQGKFKWFVLELSDTYTKYFDKYNILTPKQILRMHDAELYAELMLIFEQGIINKSKSSIDKLYKKYDNQFDRKDSYLAKFDVIFNIIFHDLKGIEGSFMMKSYSIHSLFTALAHLKYGIPDGESAIGIPSTGTFYADREKAVQELLALAEAHENKEQSGKFGEYVIACLTTTTKAAQRRVRTKYISKALLGELYDEFE